MTKQTEWFHSYYEDGFGAVKHGSEESARWAMNNRGGYIFEREVVPWVPVDSVKIPTPIDQLYPYDSLVEILDGNDAAGERGYVSGYYGDKVKVKMIDRSRLYGRDQVKLAKKASS